MGLRLVNRELVRLDIGDDGDYIEVRKDISRREFNQLMSALPSDGISEDSITFGVASTFAEGLFDVFVEGWSLDVPPTVENYNELTRDSASQIDSAISEHFNSLTPDGEETQKSEESSEE